MRRFPAATRVLVTTPLLLCAIALALSASPSDALAQRPTKTGVTANPKPGEIGYIFTDYITVGDDASVPCKFSVTAADVVQVGTGRVGERAIPESAKGDLHLPKQAVDEQDDGKTYAVISLGDSSFRNCTYLTSTGLGSNATVTSVGDSAFLGCTQLTSTELESNATVTSVGDSAFLGCTQLASTGLESNATVTSLGGSAFADCASLRSTGLGTNATVTSLDGPVFSGCTALSSTGLELNTTVTSLGDSAFSKCTRLTSTGLESNSAVKSVGSSAFSDCTSLTSTGLGANHAVKSVGSSAFHKCTSLTSTGLESNATVTSLGDSAFMVCTHLTSTGLGSNDTVTSLGDHTFSSCTSLTSTGLGSNQMVQSVGESVFSSCASLTSTGLESNHVVTSVGNRTFEKCTSLTSTGLESNSTVTSVGNYLFASCTSLISTGLESNHVVARLGDSVFLNCTHLTSTGLESNSTVTSLGLSIFDYCTHLTSTGLESNRTVTNLAEYAFSNCTSLTSTGLGSNSTVKLLSEFDFSGCTSLTSTGLESNSTVTMLKGSVFSGCTSLTSTGLTENRTVSSIGSRCFSGCSVLGTKPDATGQAETGDLVLNAPEGGGKLNVSAQAFENSALCRLYLRGKRERFEIGSTALSGARQLSTLYVPSSWAGTESCVIGGKTFNTADGTLVTMGVAPTDVSASRTPLTSDAATVMLTVNTGMDVSVTGAWAGLLVERAHLAPAAPGDRMQVDIPSGAGLSPDAETLTISAPDGAIYPASSGARNYNKAAVPDARCDLAAVSYRIAFDPNGGTGSMFELPMAYDTYAQLPPCVFTREHFDPAGWSTAADGTGLLIPEGGTVENLTNLEGATVTLYTQWAPVLTLSALCRSQDKGGGKGQPLAGCGLALSSTPDASGEIFDVYTDPGRTSPVGGWPIGTDAAGELRLYGLSTGTYHLLILKLPAGYEVTSPDAATLTIAADGTVSVNGSEPVKPVGGVATVGLSLASVSVLPQTGRTAGAVAAVAAASLTAVYLAARRAAHG